MPPPSLRILCLGDSLTAGYPADHPYAEQLAKRLRAAFPATSYSAGRTVEVDVDGIPGDLVTRGTFLRRMEARWARETYDWTIILGGTNDIGWGYSPDPIFDSLEKLWDIPLSRGGKVLALTIPETKSKYEDMTNHRLTLNKRIQEYQRENFHTFDLFKALPYHGMSPAEREWNWDMDGLHLTEIGYDLMGSKIAGGLIKILHLEEAQMTDISSVINDARQKKLVEELIFEEEIGDPKLLSQGYIVVRKRDLD
ncbi:SGNH hydrolase-type esterase domain-containing protein [Xylariales sp. PMI_506]|nr:SGNH hydrolase-type esterase domain-containing protein [Xylariales sp. PMI_506]